MANTAHKHNSYLEFGETVQSAVGGPEMAAVKCRYHDPHTRTELVRMRVRRDDGSEGKRQFIVAEWLSGIRAIAKMHAQINSRIRITVFAEVQAGFCTKRLDGTGLERDMKNPAADRCGVLKAFVSGFKPKIYAG